MNPGDVRSVLTAVGRYEPDLVTDSDPMLFVLACAMFDHAVSDPMERVTRDDLRAYPRLLALTERWPVRRAGRALRVSGRASSPFASAEGAVHAFLTIAAEEWKSLPKRVTISPIFTDRIASACVLVSMMTGERSARFEMRTYARCVELARVASFLSGRTAVDDGGAQAAVSFAIGGAELRRLLTIRYALGREDWIPTSALLALLGVGLHMRESEALRAMTTGDVLTRRRAGRNNAFEYRLTGVARELCERAALTVYIPPPTERRSG